MAITKGRTSTAQRTAALKIGDAAPEIALATHTGGTWKLSEMKGKKNVVLAFYPFAFSAV